MTFTGFLEHLPAGWTEALKETGRTHSNQVVITRPERAALVLDDAMGASTTQNERHKMKDTNTESGWFAQFGNDVSEETHGHLIRRNAWSTVRSIGVSYYADNGVVQVLGYKPATMWQPTHAPRNQGDKHATK